MVALHQLLAMLILVVPLTAGCVSPSNPSEEEGFRWGLGLEVPAVMPGLGDFQEPIAEIQYWDEWVANASDASSDWCSETESLPIHPVPYMVESNLHFFVAFGCHVDPENATNTDLRNSIEHLQEENANLLDSIDSLPNVTAIEIVANLMTRYLSIANDFGIYKAGHDEASPGEGEDPGLRSVYSRLLGGSLTLNHLLRSIPQVGSCVLHDSSMGFDLLEDYRQLLNDPPGKERLVQAEIFEQLSSNPNDIVLRNLEIAVDRDWWPLYYRHAGTYSFYRAQFEAAENGVLPTHHEAVYLHALNGNRMRALQYDTHITGDAQPLMSRSLWEQHPDWALPILARGEQTWHYGESDCTSR